MAKATKRNPWAWIPTLYFAQGIPFIFINIKYTIIITYFYAAVYEIYIIS